MRVFLLISMLASAACSRNAELTCYGYCSLGTDTNIEGLD